MMRKPDRHTVLWTAGVVAGAAAFLSLVTWPQLGRLSALGHEIEQDLRNDAQGVRNQQMAAALEQRVQDLSARTADFQQRIPRQEMLGAFVEDLARFAEQRNVASEELTPGPPVRSGDVVAQPIQLRVRGAFRDVFGLLQDLETMPRLNRIERFDTLRDPERPDQVVAEVGIRIFHRAS